MIAPSAAYQAVHDLLKRTPVYRVTFTRSGRKYSTHKICDYLTEILADAPSLYLRLGETSGTAAEDSSGNNLDGVYQNTPTLGATGAIEGSSNKAVTLNGTDEYISVADHALLDPGDTFTLEAWVKPTDLLAPYTICDKGTNGYFLRVATGGAIVFIRTGVATIVTSTSTITAGVWTHVVATKSGSTVKLYINGVDVTGTVTNSTIAGTSDALSIGRSVGGGGEFKGSIDEVAIYPTVLSATRVMAHYSAGKLGQYLSTWLDYMHMPASVGAQIDPRAGRSSNGAMTITLLDFEEEVTDLVGLGIAADTCTFEAGFEEIQGEEFEPFMTAIVESVKLGADHASYDITVRDPQALTNKDVFECAATTLTDNLARDASDTYFHHVEILGIEYHLTNSQNAATFEATLDGIYGASNWSFLSATVAVIGTTITVTSTSFFLASGYVLIDKEIIAYTGKTATTFTGLTRGALGSTSAVHQSGATCRELLRIGPAHLCDIIQSIYTRSDKRGLGLGPDYEGEVIADGADLYLRMGDGSGTTARDYSGNGLDGSYVNTPTLGVDGPLVADSNSAVTLTAASSEYVSVADHALLDPGDTFSLEAWVKLVASGVNQYFITKGVNGYAFGLDGTGTLVLGKQGVATIVAATSGALSAGVWHHVVATKSGATVKLYIDGVDVTGTVTNQTIVGTATDLSIGRVTDGTLYLNGSIDEVAIYPTALSATRVLAHYTAGTVTTIIDGAAFKAVKQSIGPSYEMEFRITSRFNAQQFLEAELFSKAACYPVTTGAGLLSIREASEPEDSDAVATIDEDSIVVENSKAIIGWDGNLTSRINHVVYEYDYDPAETNEKLKYKSSREDEDPISVVAFGRSTLVLKSQGLRSELAGTTAFIDSRMALILQRFLNGAPLVPVRTHMQKNLIQPGEVIRLSSSILPNRFLRSRGVTNSLFEVIKRTVGFKSGSIDWELLWTGFAAGGGDNFNRANVLASADPTLDTSDREIFWIASPGRLSSVDIFAIVSNELRVGQFGTGTFANGWMYRATGDYRAAVLADQPSLYLRLGETSGTAAEDSSGNNLDGVYQNTPTLGTEGHPNSPDFSVTLNGTNEYISVADNALIDASNNTITVEAWIYLSSLATPQTICDKGTNGYLVYVNTAGAIVLASAGVGDLASSFSAAVLVNTWHHVVVRKEGANTRFFVDGALNRSVTSASTISATASDLNIGRTVAGADYLTGSIDELAIYQTALPTERVLAHYNATLPTPYSNNQFSELTFRSVTGTPRNGPAVRQSGSTFTSYTGYAVVYTGTEITLRRYSATDLTAGSGTPLGNVVQALAAGDVLRIQVSGTTLRVYLNGTAIIGPITDATIASGAVGVMSNVNGAGDSTLWDNWRGGDGDGWA